MQKGYNPERIPSLSREESKGFAPILIVFLVAILGIGGYFWLNYSNKQGSTATPPIQCERCNSPQDTTCRPGTSCFVPNGLSEGVCTPVPKPGQGFTISQINSFCGTNFPENETANWKTFNDGYYSFNFPETWSARTVLNNKNEYYSHSVEVKSPTKTVTINISTAPIPYGFEAAEETKTNDLNFTIEGKDYTTKETIRANKKAFVDLRIKNNKEHQVLFGTGYPTGDDDKYSLSDYLSLKETIIKIVSTLKIEEN